MLADRLGVTVGELRGKMTARDLIYWAAYRARRATLEREARDRAAAGGGRGR